MTTYQLNLFSMYSIVASSKLKGLCICSHNVNHLSNNIGELKLFLQCDNLKIDVCGLNETFLTDRDHDDMFNIQGYQTIREDRTYSRGGGLFVYIRNEINYKHRQDLEAPADETTEIVWVELMISNKSLLIAQVYRPPKLELKFAQIG